MGVPKSQGRSLHKHHPKVRGPVRGNLVGVLDGCVLHLPMDEGFGDVVHDRSGCGNHGAIYGATWTEEGKIGRALRFDGVDDYVETGVVPFTSNDITVEAWIYLKSTNTYTTIIHKGDRSGEKNFLFTFDIFTFPDPKIRFDITDDGYDYDYVAGSTTLELNKWYHVVGVYRAADKFLAVYVNGRLDGSKTSEKASLYQGTSKYWIGARYDNGEFFTDRYFNGTIDEVRIYNRARTSDEVSLSFASHPFSTPHIKGRVFLYSVR